MALLAAVCWTAEAHAPEEEMAEAAHNLLAALPPELKAKAVFAWDDAEKVNWHFIPRARKGLSIKEMRGDQRDLTYGLLSSALSHKGYLKATTIMSLEQILLEIEQGKGPVRDPELYFVSVFGEPSAKGTWAWRFEGHHLSMNFTIVNGKYVSATPSFFGTNPGEVREGPRKGLRVLGAEEDMGRELAKSLTPEQAKLAVFSETAPPDVITGADRNARMLEPHGVPLAKLSAKQAETFWRIVEAYIGRARGELASAELEEIRGSGPEKLFFAWAGALEPGKGHYYRVQGPTFLLEYDNTQNNANHVHAVWRDLKNDFGDDILRRHYEESPHHKK